MTSPAYLYLAVPEEDERFKIGRSVSPASRFRALGLDTLDLERTRVLTGSPGHIAKAESVLHFMLESWRSPHPHGGDGHTEWFDRQALVTATDYVTDLARRDDRFALADPRELLHPPRPTPASRRDTRASARARFLEGVNGRAQALPEGLAGLRGHLERICGAASGVIDRPEEGDALLCYDGLRREELRVLSSITTEASVRGENLIMVPGMSAAVIACGRWCYHDGKGMGIQTLHYGELPRMTDTLASYRDEPGINVAELNAAVAAMQETRDAIDRLLGALPRMPARWRESFEVHHSAAVASI